MICSSISTMNVQLQVFGCSDTWGQRPRCSSLRTTSTWWRLRAPPLARRCPSYLWNDRSGGSSAIVLLAGEQTLSAANSQSRIHVVSLTGKGKGGPQAPLLSVLAFVSRSRRRYQVARLMPASVHGSRPGSYRRGRPPLRPRAACLDNHLGQCQPRSCQARLFTLQHSIRAHFVPLRHASIRLKLCSCTVIASIFASPAPRPRSACGPGGDGRTHAQACPAPSRGSRRRATCRRLAA